MVFSLQSEPSCCKQDKSRLYLVVGKSSAGKNVCTETEDVFGIRHQATTGEDTDDWEDLVNVVSNFWVCELAIALWLLIVTICKWSINQITNPNPVCSHSYTWHYVDQWLGSALSKGPNWVGVSPLPENGNRSDFRHVFIAFRIPDGGRSPKTKQF
jgi:hypothetical protein